jgi:septal ring factor EnvC (AmiA/AmiB activator)
LAAPDFRGRPAWPAGRRALGLCALALLLVNGSAHGARPTERSKQKAAAEAQRAGLQQKLTALKRDIGRTESAKDNAADTLAESEQAISNANRTLRELAAEQGQTGVRLRELNARRERLAATVDMQKKQLARLLREQYLAGNEDRIKLLLSGDNPNRINRDLQMMAYVSQAQAQLLGALRANLQAVEANQAEAQNARDELEEIAQEEREQKVLLEQEKGRRAALLTSLSKRLAEQRKEAGNVARDEQRMAGLVDRLGKLIREQAEAAAAEKRRLEQLAAARARAEAEAKVKARAEADAKALARAREQGERERLTQESAKSKAPLVAQTGPNGADPGPKVAPVAPAARSPEPRVKAELQPKADAQPKLEPPPEPSRAADIALGPAAPEGAFKGLRGQLRAPVTGKLAARFGSKRGDGPLWKGVFIQAAEGADVRAVAAGRIVFAEWLRGFGNLIIVDHGGQYMSIYGNNSALLKRAGDAVKASEPIASAGNSGGNEESGLYFELRHQGRAFDPAGWVKF